MNDILLFQVHGQRFGLRAARVREVQRVVAIVPLPNAPAAVEGLIDVRGRLVPVYGIRSRFRMPAREVEPSDHLVLAEARGRLVALRVDRVLDLVRIDEQDVEDPSTLVDGVGTEFVAGVARMEDGLVLIHDLDTFLSQAEEAELDAAIAGGPP